MLEIFKSEEDVEEENKAKYREMKANWAKFVNDVTNMPVKEKDGHIIPCKIKGFHHMLYNLLRGFPIDRGFKLDSPLYIYNLECLERMIKYRADSLIKPFGVITREDIRDIL